MTKKHLWNQLRRLRRQTHEERMEQALFEYFDVRGLKPLDNCRTPGFTDKGYLKRRVIQPLEYGRP